MTLEITDPTDLTVSILGHHEEQLRSAMAETARQRPNTGHFEPDFALPETTDRLTEFFSATDLRFAHLGQVRSARMLLLDLMGNPRTRTVKTLASHVIVARAVRHIETTGERIMILTPSSANKATALRDAVLRAYETGLADPERLRIVTLVPDVARPKLWSSGLDQDPAAEERNPLCVLDPGTAGQHVKTIAQDVARDSADELFTRYGFRLWHTLDLDNYRCADAARAFAERAALPAGAGVTRTHAHAVSSAFGLLGHHFGTTLLPETAQPPQYFLVQSMDTPDMVLSLYGMNPPEYRKNAADSLYHQKDDPRYPETTYNPVETLESTFYTRSPATSPAMNELIRRDGGGGVVVSLHECLSRYGEIRALLEHGGVRLPEDPRTLREWSLVMVMTGVLNALDRGLLTTDEVVVHASGSYSTADFTPLPDRSLHRVDGQAALRRELFQAASFAGAGR